MPAVAPPGQGVTRRLVVTYRGMHPLVAPQRVRTTRKSCPPQPAAGATADGPAGIGWPGRGTPGGGGLVSAPLPP